MNRKTEKLIQDYEHDDLSFDQLIKEIINSAKEECAMIFENQISDENTDEANTNLSLNAKAIRDSKE